MLKKYLDIRIKGKLDNEIYCFSYDIGLGSDVHIAKTKTSFLQRKMYKIKNKNNLMDWHIRRIKKYASSKHIKLTDKQQNFINELIAMEGIDWWDVDIRDFNNIDDKRKEILNIPLIFSISSLSLNAFEWMIIIAVLGLYLLIKSCI